MKNLEKTHPCGVKALLFDLDGTLLQVEMRTFIPAYLHELGERFTDIVPREQFARVARHAVQLLLLRGDRRQTNRERYLAVLESRLDIRAGLFEERLNGWLEDGLENLAGHVSPIDKARPLLDHCFGLGVPVVLATNPVFPAAVIEARLAWAGLDDYPFTHVTSYENTRYCKPQKGYFLDLLEGLRVSADECLMIGNDTQHDLAAASVGVPTFLAETFMVDRLAGNYSSDYRGDLDDLLQLLRACC